MRISVVKILIIVFAIMLANSIRNISFSIKPTSLTDTIIKVEPIHIEFGNSDGDPISIPETKFNVTTIINNVENLYGFDLKLNWSTTYLEYVSHSIRVPKDTYPDGVLWNPVIKLKDEVNTTAGTYWIAYASMYPAPSFNGTGAVFTMTFKVVKQPYDFETGGLGVDRIDVTLGFSSTSLAEFYTANPIQHITENATIRIWERRSKMPSCTILKIMPEKIENIPTEKTFNISIWIIGIDQSLDVANLSVTLNFNSTLVKANEIVEGSWPKNYAENSTVIMKQINNTAGTATYSLELVPPRTLDPPTAGIIFTVTFYVTYESPTYPPPFFNFTLNPTEICDRNIGPVAHTTENSKYVAYRIPPTAKFTWIPASGILIQGQTIIFNASESFHPLGIKLYIWDFGDGNQTTINTPIITHVYTITGTIEVILSVIDYENFSSITSAKFYLFESPPKPYLAVEPSYLKLGQNSTSVAGTKFNISVYIKELDVTWSLFNAKFSISYNSTLIEIANKSIDIIVDPDLWQESNEIEIAHEQYSLSKVVINLTQTRGATKTGNVLAVTIQFTIKHQGNYPDSDTSPLILGDINLVGTFGHIPTQSPVNGQVVIEGLKISEGSVDYTPYIITGTGATIIIVLLIFYLVKIKKHR